VEALSSGRNGFFDMMYLFHYRELIRNLVLKDLKLKYRGSTLGFLWSLANPLMIIIVYNFVFTRMLRVDMPNFAFFLLVGFLPWGFFSQSIMMATGSILENGNLLRKVYLPSEVFPIATVLFNLVQFLLALAVLFPLAVLLFHLPLSWSMLGFVPILALHVLFTLGLSFAVSTATVFFRDVRHFTELFMMLLFWFTPIIYDIHALPEYLQKLVQLNPASFFIVGYQDVFYRHVLPSGEIILAQVFVGLASLTLGYGLFRSCKARFAEEV
jgi:ABC-2 type transport system permease protein